MLESPREKKNWKNKEVFARSKPKLSQFELVLKYGSVHKEKTILRTQTDAQIQIQTCPETSDARRPHTVDVESTYMELFQTHLHIFEYAHFNLCL